MSNVIPSSALLQPDVRVPRVRTGPAERDLDGALLPYLAALRTMDGDGAVALVVPLDDETRARLAREMVGRPAMFGASAVKAVMASTPKVVLGRIMGAVQAAHAWRCYVMQDSDILGRS
jgi:hypothetical protein